MGRSPFEIRTRHARGADLARIVEMLADDPLGAQRERNVNPLPSAYVNAFACIDRDANNELIVAESDGRVVGVVQITFIPCLTYEGRWRALLEGVRVAFDTRQQGVGRILVERAIARARERECHLVQLTTDSRRPDAQRFYEALGFKATHAGMKLHLG